jgi:MoaA/NifB/PqqE/SkfB family radical SAM enzyme
MQIKGVNFLITFRCPSGCKHCSYKAGFHRTGFMHVSHVSTWLRTIKERHPLECVTIHGGEPFLYLDIVKHILTEAKLLAIPRVWIITNGYWAKDGRTTERKLQELRKAGLSCITVSIDAFHQEYIPVEQVKRAIEYSLVLGFDTVAVDSYFLGSEKDDNQYNIQTEQILQELQAFTDVHFSRYPLRLEGRGAETLASCVKTRQEIPSGTCRFPFWLGGDFHNPETIEIDFEGNVTLCPGLSIGNARNESLMDILERYDARTHPLISILNQKGPVGLYDLAMNKGYDGIHAFVDKCHLCYEMRKFLRPYYARFLAPSVCY